MQNWVLFLALEFPRGLTQFCGTSRGGALFCLEFLREKQQTLKFHVFFKNVCLQPPLEQPNVVHQYYDTSSFFSFLLSPAGNQIFKVNNGNTRTRCEICSKLTIKTPERHQQRLSGVFTVKFEPISQLVLVFLLLTFSW